MVWPQAPKKELSKRSNPNAQALVQPLSVCHLLMPIGQSEACGEAQSQRRIDSHKQKQELLEFLKMVSIFLCMCTYSRTKTSWKFLACSFYRPWKHSLHTPPLYAKNKIAFTRVLIPHGTRLCSLEKSINPYERIIHWIHHSIHLQRWWNVSHLILIFVRRNGWNY